MTTATREIHTGWTSHKTLPDTFLAYAECDDEQTQLILMNPPQALKDIYLVDVDAASTSPAYRLLVDEHRSRCAACAAWESEA